MRELLEMVLGITAAYGGCKTCEHKDPYPKSDDHHCYMFEKKPGFTCAQHKPVSVDKMINDMVEEQINKPKEPPCTE